MSLPAFTLWLSGRPGAGKTTLAGLLGQALRDLGLGPRVLDSASLRPALWPGAGYSPAERRMVNLGAAWLAATLNQHGVTCLVAMIAPYAELRAQVRARLPRYVEVYLDCPLEQAVNRDPQGLYARALAGELPLFTGVGDPYEEPEAPEIVCPTSLETPAQSLARVVAWLEGAGYLPPGSAKFCAPAGQAATGGEQAQVESRLRDLGYID